MASSFRLASVSNAALVLLTYLSHTYAQQISVNTAVPPLQWLNITNLLQGATAPPLKDASIGYDDTTRQLIIFGGESSSGIPTQQTFLLNLATLVWSTPAPLPNLPQGSPPARSMAVGGEDLSSSYRSAHLIIGGQGANGEALSDAWEFDYQDQFWSAVQLSGTGPPARWSASGGRDYRIPADTSSTNTTFYMSGGTDGTSMFPLSDVWELSMSGTISANLATNNLYGTWTNAPIKTVGSGGYSVDQASTVLSSSIVSVSGCNTTDDTSESCAEGSSYVMNSASSAEISPPACPVPRYGGALAPNFCSYPAAAYSTQVFLLLGTFNSSFWDDQGGLQKGEVAVLDIETGSWSRILPAGDPGTTGIPAFPSPREGAVALSFATALVGDDRAIASDTIVFGGKDESGTYLNEVWILRAYNGSISSSNGSWGAPDGDLQTGVNANGAGVTIQYMTQCAVELMTPTATAPSATSTAPSQESFQTYDVSFAHKLLAPLSIALLLPAILLSRVALPSAQASRPVDRNMALLYLSGLVALAAYGAGIGGLISSFTSISSTMTMFKRAPSGTILRTGHGVAGLALIVGLYALVPFLYILSFCATSSNRPPKVIVDHSEPPASRANSTDTAEKLAAYTAAQRTEYPPASPSSPRARLHSWGGSSFWLGRSSREGRASTDSESVHSAGPQRAFEVVNRPARTRRASSQGLAHPSMDVYQRVPVAPRSLGDVDWLDRRRSLNAVNELDYAVHQGNRANGFSSSSTPPTIDVLSTRALVPHANFPRAIYEIPQPFETCLRILFHALVLALCILSLAALWYRATKALFAVFLLWTVLFYCSLFALAWNGRPRKSILTALIARLRAQPPPPAGSPGTPTSRPLSMVGNEQYPFPTDTRGPYLHQPPYRPAGHDDVSTSHGGPRSVETDDDDEDVDEETRQRRIEEEMGRREVSIVTVPKRRLWITNPS
ncbi:hypothetical protein BV22DRAFT_1080880 [Leucogyrophana mollusca]|uniref:Uncharacterized protein n=1 Tax=Leucogyrophana mollusca TaxID=85980 RepID=A0ACB8BX63_9AGAM|nr:hypothetical protein BV22DRAFT_1080880 [Leucogyrophana mollusca]